MGTSILHTIRSMNPAHGGPVEVVKQLSSMNGRMDCTVEIASLDAPGDPWVGNLGLPIHALGEQTSAAGAGYGYSSRFVPWLLGNRNRYSAVISHGLWQYNNAGVWRALRGTDTPYFVFPHGMLDGWFKRAYPAKHYKKWVYWILQERKIFRDARAVIFTCQEEQRASKNTFRPYRCDERVITLGIAPPVFAYPKTPKSVFFERLPELSKKRILLFLGRLHDKKGCDLLIEAFGRITSGSGGEFHLVMAGPCADEAYLQQMRGLAGRHCPPGSVSFPGMLSGDLKWGAFQAAEAFVLPSHQENFGIAVVEALACGVPVLISNRVNIWREIEEDGAGSVQADDAAGTLALLENWRALDQAGRDRMRLAALACFSDRFHITRTAHELLALIASCAR